MERMSMMRFADGEDYIEMSSDAAEIPGWKKYLDDFQGLRTLVATENRRKVIERRKHELRTEQEGLASEQTLLKRRIRNNENALQRLGG
jgi:hypothetical protein